METKKYWLYGCLWGLVVFLLLLGTLSIYDYYFYTPPTGTGPQWGPNFSYTSLFLIFASIPILALTPSDSFLWNYVEVISIIIFMIIGSVIGYIYGKMKA
jgi:hypothetical protein